MAKQYLKVEDRESIEKNVTVAIREVVPGAVVEINHSPYGMSIRFKVPGLYLDGRCTAVTSRGKRCKLAATDGCFCPIHANLAENSVVNSP